ncbi:hypothetical protein MIR68_011478 [Amoeboaphelidium protococcarum]|nr:hypothetical protein MIR68_011478 [Amoeboaphelidium protococcarum]
MQNLARDLLTEQCVVANRCHASQVRLQSEIERLNAELQLIQDTVHRPQLQESIRKLRDAQDRLINVNQRLHNINNGMKLYREEQSSSN